MKVCRLRALHAKDKQPCKKPCGECTWYEDEAVVQALELRRDKQLESEKKRKYRRQPPII